MVCLTSDRRQQQLQNALDEAVKNDEMCTSTIYQAGKFAFNRQIILCFVFLLDNVFFLNIVRLLEARTLYQIDGHR